MCGCDVVTVVEIEVPRGCSVRLQLEPYPKPLHIALLTFWHQLIPDIISRILGFKLQDIVFLNANSYTHNPKDKLHQGHTGVAKMG